MGCSSDRGDDKMGAVGSSDEEVEGSGGRQLGAEGSSRQGMAPRLLLRVAAEEEGGGLQLRLSKAVVAWKGNSATNGGKSRRK
ncbi:hypothetical protein BHE74_00012165 [Ensete ventricosum]|nr:hypothetical protein GW17_00028774 [Ensete ventricosum]RWW79527.1 hypothetical protein BHE74_00012165 [Ensete ventricosum]